MRLFLDTANIDEIRDAVRMGVLSGVTTNPSLMSKESGITYRERVVEICEIEGHPFMVASQFHPEFRSRPLKPHPLFRDFIGAAIARRDGESARERPIAQAAAEVTTVGGAVAGGD